MKKSTLKTIGVVTLASAPFLCGISLSLGLTIYFGVKSIGIFDDFENSEMFQEVKEQEVARMKELEKDYYEAQYNYASDKISLPELNAAKNQYNAQKDYVESDSFVFDYMPQDTWQKYDSLQEATAVAGITIPITGIGGVMLSDPILNHFSKKEKELTE